ncbi:hypothetical protein JAAARDRAFT_198802 [Jaapia argillacea MUCL 33604]|uniref:Uncharacterized protein n=1 Tax=Jaapia argillacea MUCL 33604 TaxID=933084 RepID=A0A067PB27_9AGAM|nr:hypothetical protein JAAARDRAFT_198802 [Jaapia argillacea MUCL 33604]
MQVTPEHDIWKPFSVEQVVDAAKYVLNPERFDADDLEMDDKGVDDSTPTSESLETESDDDENAATRRRQNEKGKGRKKVAMKQRAKELNRSREMKNEASEGQEREVIVGKLARTVLKRLEQEGEEAQFRDEMENLIW